jgi:hypothetical protein
MRESDQNPNAEPAPGRGPSPSSHQASGHGDPMPGQLRMALEEMHAKIATGSSDSNREVALADLAQWRDALGDAIERLDALALISQLAIDAFLLRSAEPGSTSGKARASSRSIAQARMNRLASAMVALEREVTTLRADVLPSTAPES